MKLFRYLIIIMGISVSFLPWCAAFDTAHFFRPPFLERGPWFAQDWLTALYVNAAYGATDSSRNSAGDKVCLLDLYGPFSVPAKAYITESVIELYQNFRYGLFLHTHLPIRRIKLFSRQRGVGDLGIALGWAYNYEDFEHLDFLDTTFQFGVTTPTSKQSKARHIFDIPLGYNGHTGFFGKFDASIGVLDWMTFGLFATGMGFNKHTSLERIKIDASEGIATTSAPQPVRVSLGSIATAGFLLRADHFVRGCSLDIEYQFQYQGKSRWFLCESQQPYTVCDERLQSWNMHTINIELSYDFSNINHPHLPIIGFIYNIPVGGKRIFMDPMGGGSVALMTSWCW